MVKLEDMSVADLRKRMTKRKIANRSKITKKDDMIEALREGKKSSPKKSPAKRTRNQCVKGLRRGTGVYTLAASAKGKCGYDMKTTKSKVAAKRKNPVKADKHGCVEKFTRFNSKYELMGSDKGKCAYERSALKRKSPSEII